VQTDAGTFNGRVCPENAFDSADLGHNEQNKEVLVH
jgi:hypothetical protein